MGDVGEALEVGDGARRVGDELGVDATGLRADAAANAAGRSPARTS